MHYQSLGPFAGISRLTLGGGGIGQGWGETSGSESRTTIRAAISAGINLIDTAPIYNNCERIIASTFEDKLPQGVRITSKCQLGERKPGTVKSVLEESLNTSLKQMRLSHIDLFFLHSNVCEGDAIYAHGQSDRARFATPWSQYESEVIPALEQLKRDGRIGAWGITGIGIPQTVIKALNHTSKPDVVQIIANLLDSAGGIRRYAEPAEPRRILEAAIKNGVGVMGVRAVQAGALTQQLDRTVKASHPDFQDYIRAAPYRTLCSSTGADPAELAHRYALQIEGIDTLVLGVMNRDELKH